MTRRRIVSWSSQRAAATGSPSTSAALIRIHDSTVTHDDLGLGAVNGGQIVSFENDALLGNPVGGAPTRKTKLG